MGLVRKNYPKREERLATAYKCDVCKELREGKNFQKIVGMLTKDFFNIGVQIQFYIPGDQPRSTTIDVCKDCAKNIVRFVCDVEDLQPLSEEEKNDNG